jgi:WD40 repeat protein
LEGHLALDYSPDGAFSPDGGTLAFPSQSKIVLLNLAQNRPEKVLKIHLQNVTDLDIQSASYISPTRVFVMARGLFQSKGQKGLPARTPQLAFQWYVDQDELFGTVNALAARGGFGPLLYFPEFELVGLYKNSNFDFWNPNSGRAIRLTIPDLTHQPNLYAVSPDGHWMILAQIETSSSTDPVVVILREHKFLNTLTGHQGTVLCLRFSRDSQRVLTACEDGKVRIYSVGDWRLLYTLSGHQGPVHWAEFSLDGKWVASAGEDKTVRVWSADDGKLLQVLSESQSPLLTVGFSPTGEFLTASAEHTVLVWKRTFGGR